MSRRKVDTERERRIEGHLDGVAEGLRASPERTAAMLGGDLEAPDLDATASEDPAPRDAQVSIRLASSTVERAEAIAARMEAYVRSMVSLPSGTFTRSEVFRHAIEKGLDALEKSFGPEPRA